MQPWTGFHNAAVHNDQKSNLKITRVTLNQRLNDFRQFATVMEKLARQTKPANRTPGDAQLTAAHFQQTATNE